LLAGERKLSKRILSAKQTVADIKAGIIDADLMEKYRLTPKGLQNLFSKLIAANLITADELEARNQDPAGRASETVAPTYQSNEDADGEKERNADPIPESADKETSLSSDLRVISESSSSEEGQEKSEYKWYEHWFVILLAIILLFPFGLLLLWKSRRLKTAAKILLSVCLCVPVGSAFFYFRDNSGSNAWLWQALASQMSRFGQVESQETNTFTMDQRESLGPFDEKAPPLPVHRVQKNASSKEILRTIIQLTVLMHDATPKQYYAAVRYFIQHDPPDNNVLLRDFFAEEYGCQMDPDDMEMMTHIVNDLIKDKIAKEFSGQAQTVTSNDNDEEARKELERRSQWLRGESFIKRLSLVKKDTASCSKAVREILKFVSSTADKSISDYREYEKAILNRGPGIP
jgi:hypothetical protein